MTESVEQSANEINQAGQPSAPAVPLWRRCLRWRILLLLLFLIGIGCAVDAFLIEPNWIRIRPVDLADGKGTLRVVHITDIHYRGDADRLRRVVKKINQIDADMVCFTGDLIEDDESLAADALAILGSINKPTYGIRGNHDIWAVGSIDFANTELRRTGGFWVDWMTIRVDQKGYQITGDIRQARKPTADPNPTGAKRILLVHSPSSVDKVTAQKYDLILAGHTHGGQIRLPFIGNPVYRQGPYEQGLYETPSGPLYVNPGLGTYWIRARFFCRPEITVISF